MDSDYITYRHGKRIEYPYIDFDEDGNAYLVTEHDAIRYPYTDTVANTDDANNPGGERFVDPATVAQNRGDGSNTGDTESM